MPNKELIKAYLYADIFVLLSLKEPAGIAIIEAMSAGLPVLCVDTGGPAYIVDETCGIKIALATKKNMISNIAEAIDTLANSPQKVIEMRKKAQDRIKQWFTWDVVIRKMLKIYDEVTNGIQR